MKGLTIGKLAKKAGVGIDTIRFYERRRLIAEPARTQSNYRVYVDGDISRLRFIKKAKELGFTLNEIKELLTLRHDPTAAKAEVKARTEEKIKDIRTKIVNLSKILNVLEQLSSSCDGHGSADDCPILKALDAEDCGHS